MAKREPKGILALALSGKNTSQLNTIAQDVENQSSQLVSYGLVDDSNLTVQAGQYYSVANALIENIEFTSQVTVQGQNVSFYNCRFTGGNLFQVRNNNGKTDTNFINCEFDLNNLTSPSAVNQEMINLKMYNCLIKNVKGGDAIKLIDGNELHDVLVKDFIYIEGSHPDGIQIERGSNILINGVNIEADDTINNCLRINTGQGIVDNVAVSNCYFNGGGFTIAIGDNGTNTLTNIVLRDNIVGDGAQYGAYTTTTTAVGSAVPDVDSSNVYEKTRRSIV